MAPEGACENKKPPALTGGISVQQNEVNISYALYPYVVPLE